MNEFPERDGKMANYENGRRASSSVTLHDVAKLAGVAPTTVSRVLNQPEKVAQKTLEKVQKAIDMTGYVPNLLAGGLASNKSHLIAAIVPSISNLVYAETIRHFSDVLRAEGYQVLLGEASYLEGQEEKLVAAILSRRPDGIFLTGINHSDYCRRLLISADVPVVETWDLTPTPLDIVVGFSHHEIGVAMAEFLWNKGYREIGLVTATDPRAMVRQKAFVETLQRLGAPEVVISHVGAPTSFELGRNGLAQLLDNGFKGEVVFCSSDTIAQGALAEIQSRGISIPDELALVGFGDQPYAAHTHPALTTIRFDRARIGRTAAEAMLARINGQNVEQRVVDVGFSIVERETG